jgi:tetratricopeptide (TPR) repeat protein
LARLLLRRRKYGEVLTLYEKAIKRDGGNRDRYTADLGEHSAKFLLAEEELRRNGALAPPPVTTRPALSLVHGTYGRKPAGHAEVPKTTRDRLSIEFLEDSVGADPANSRLRRELSICYMQAGRLIEARCEAEMAEQLTARRAAAV